MKLVILLLLVAAPSFAKERIEQDAGFQMHQFSSASTGLGTEDAEFIDVAPANRNASIRQHHYQIVSNGTIGDFSDINYKSNEAHAYFIFPNTKDISFSANTPGAVKVTSSSGLILTFKNGALDKISDDEGGSPCAFAKPFTIGACQRRIVFDTGPGTTNGAYANLAGKTKIIDPDGKTCSVVNSTLFGPLPGRTTKADVQMKPMSTIAKALRANPDCKGLNLALLQGGGGSSSAGSRSAAPSNDGSSGGQDMNQWLGTLPASRPHNKAQ